MSNVALHMRITGTQVSDEDVNRRNAAVADLAITYNKMRAPGEILATAAEIAVALGGTGTPPDRLGRQVQAAVQAHASSFIYSERPLEVGICSGMAVYSIISKSPISTNGWTFADVMAAGLWSALSFQTPLLEPKREALRIEVLTAAQDRVTRAAEGARVRLSVPEFGPLSIETEETEETEETGEANEAEKFPSAFKEATAATIDALRRNAVLDREELDFLWWVMLNRSRLLKKPLPDLDEPVRVVAAGIEAAANLRKLPCDVHHELVQRSISTDAKFDLAELLTAIGGDCSALAMPFTGDVLNTVSGVFPLLHALSAGSAGMDDVLVKRMASEWGCRALLEASIFHMMTGTADKL